MIHIPLSAGGGIRSLADASLLVNSGADKLIFASSVFTRPESVDAVSRTFGKQSCVAILNYRGVQDEARVFLEAGKLEYQTLRSSIELACEIGFGDLIVHSIDRDGTGTGLDLSTLKLLGESMSTPLVASGGIGTSDNMVEGLALRNVEAIATANILNFVGSGFRLAREHVGERIELPRFIPQIPSD
jgi:cyclase